MKAAVLFAKFKNIFITINTQICKLRSLVRAGKHMRCRCRVLALSQTQSGQVFVHIANLLIYSFIERQLNMKRVLITGITGYNGSNLARSLLSEFEIYGLVREPINLEYIADIAPRIHFLIYDGGYPSMAAALEQCRPDLVYHLAAYYTGSHGTEQTPKLISSNVTLGAYLLEAMSACGSPAFVYVTTYMTHYRGELYCPANLYAATKQAFTDILTYYADSGLLRAVTLTVSDVYGPGDHRFKVLNVVKRAVKSGERMAFPAKDIPYDVVYIDDVVAALRLAGEQLMQGNLLGGTFQIVPENPLSLRETVEKMLEVNHLTLNAGWGERPAADREMSELIRLYPTLPGRRPKVSLEDGLRLMMRD